MSCPALSFTMAVAEVDIPPQGGGGGWPCVACHFFFLWKSSIFSYARSASILVSEIDGLGQKSGGLGTLGLRDLGCPGASKMPIRIPF